MKKNLILIILSVLLAVSWWRPWRSFTRSSHLPTRTVSFYQDSMHPWIKSDKPGKCTLCGMDLTPIFEGQTGFGGGDNVVLLSSNNITVLDVQTDEVKRQTLRRTLRVAGTLDANESKKSIISAPAAGRIEETAVDYAGVEVNKGQRLLTFYSPELTQQKYRYLVRAQRAPEQRDPTGGIAWKKGDADPYYTDLVSPLSGTVIERNVSRGQYVSEGERLFIIADASVLWFRFDVYEQQLPWLRLGQKVKVTLPALPGEEFEAVISFIDPLLDPATRTVKVRADISNPVVELDGTKQRRFKFGMYAMGEVQAAVPNRLAVPRAAVLYPGNSAYVYIDKGGGAYERRLVKPGQQGDELCEIYAGLEEGERVVTAGNVLLDAQAQFSQKDERDDGNNDAMDLTPKTGARSTDGGSRSLIPVDNSPVTKTDPTPEETTPIQDAKKRLAELYKDHPGTNLNPRISGKSVRANNPRRAPVPGSIDPIPTGGRRNLEGAMFVRMSEMRNAELTEAREAKAASSNRLTKTQCQRLEELMAVSARISEALADDSLTSFNKTMPDLPPLASQAQAELGDDTPWNDLFRPIAESGKAGSATNLEEARKQFLSFSTAMVALVKKVRKEDPEFAGLKIYHCPMAPKPGLWMQAKGPLRNPFYGSQMLTCGEEIAQ